MIGRNRTNKKLNELLKEEYSKGNIPNPGTIAKRLREYTESFNLEGPEMVAPAFHDKSQFDLESFNRASAAIHSDLGALYTENVAITSEVIRQLNLQDAHHNSQLKTLEIARFQLDALLLTSAHAAGALATVGDDFSDISKVDRANTTAQVDLGLGVATLTPKRAATQRIHLGHLSPLTLFPINQITPEQEHIVDPGDSKRNRR